MVLWQDRNDDGKGSTWGSLVFQMTANLCESLGLVIPREASEKVKGQNVLFNAFSTQILIQEMPKMLLSSKSTQRFLQEIKFTSGYLDCSEQEFQWFVSHRPWKNARGSVTAWEGWTIYLYLFYLKYRKWYLLINIQNDSGIDIL